MALRLTGVVIVALLLLGGRVTAEEVAAVEALGLPEAVDLLATACAGSPMMKVMFDAAEGDGTVAVAEVCACVVEVVGPRITLADAEMLAAELGGTMTPEARAAYANAERLGEIAETGFTQCQDRTGHHTVD